MRYFCSINAKVAQLVEHNLAKVGVASSNLVFRSKKASKIWKLFAFNNSLLSLLFTSGNALSFLSLPNLSLKFTKEVLAQLRPDTKESINFNYDSI